METISKINDTLVSLFNVVLKLEEKALKESTLHSLSITEIHTLVAIGQGKPKTMSQVAGALKISVSTLTAAINKLVNKGYVNRFRVPEDRRIVKIELTEQGLAAVQEHEAFHVAMITDAMQGLSREEAERFATSIENLNEFLLVRRAMPQRREGPFALEPMNLDGLSIPVPIFQGGMCVGVSGSRLAAAVSACGGVGMISAMGIGYREPDFLEDGLAANKRALKREITAALAAVAHVENRGPIGVNVMCASRDYEEYVKTAVEAGAELIASGAGLPTSLPALCKGSKVKLVPIVSSARAAGIIIKNWAKKHNTAPHAIVFEGPMAGGHLGYKEEQLAAAKEEFYKNIALLKSELDSLPECKLIVSGGIYTKKDCQQVLACGADGIQLGTRFITTEECDADPGFKKVYLSCKPAGTTIISSPMGLPARVINNSFAKRLAKEKLPPDNCDKCLITCSGERADYCIKDALILAGRGNPEEGLFFCSEKAYMGNKIETVEAIFREFTEETGNAENLLWS